MKGLWNECTFFVKGSWTSWFDFTTYLHDDDISNYFLHLKNVIIACCQVIHHFKFNITIWEEKQFKNLLCLLLPYTNGKIWLTVYDCSWSNKIFLLCLSNLSFCTLVFMHRRVEILFSVLISLPKKKILIRNVRK
jgi:hypothetical protein